MNAILPERQVVDRRLKAKSFNINYDVFDENRLPWYFKKYEIDRLIMEEQSKNDAVSLIQRAATKRFDLDGD